MRKLKQIFIPLCLIFGVLFLLVACSLANVTAQNLDTSASAHIELTDESVVYNQFKTRSVVDMSNQTVSENTVSDLTIDVSYVNQAVSPSEIQVSELFDPSKILFVGNSLVEGLRLYSESDSMFAADVGISLNELSTKGCISGKTIYDVISGSDFDSVVIEMGTNELGWYSEDSFKSGYSDLISHIRSVNSRAHIFCLSIPPVSQNKSDTSSSFNNTNVIKYNTYLESVCIEDSVTFVDNTAFFGTVLPSNWTGDGMHLGASKYNSWYSFIVKAMQNN